MVMGDIAIYDITIEKLTVKKQTELELNTFIEAWKETSERNREIFLRFKEYLKKKEGVILDFRPRPGITYSLRAVHANQKEKEFFVMVDVIEGEPRWLSVCFYDAMIADPEEKGDFVREGLLGEDAMCFDLVKWNSELIRYVEARLDEAFQSAAKE
jgi:hypothetical protein